MVNTIGCVIGPIVTTFLLLPMLGAAVSVLVILALLTGAALYILHRSKPLPATRATRTILYVVTAGLLVVIILRPEIRILPPSFSRSNLDVLFYRESVEGTLSVGRDRGNRQRLQIHLSSTTAPSSAQPTMPSRPSRWSVTIRSSSEENARRCWSSVLASV